MRVPLFVFVYRGLFVLASWREIDFLQNPTLFNTNDRSIEPRKRPGMRAQSKNHPKCQTKANFSGVHRAKPFDGVPARIQNQTHSHFRTLPALEPHRAAMQQYGSQWTL